MSSLEKKPLVPGKLKSSELLIWAFLSLALHLPFLFHYKVDEIASDAFVYHHVAKNFAEKNEFLSQTDVTKFSLNKEFPDYPTNDEPLHDAGIGYPLFIGLFYKVFGSDRGAQTLVMALSSVLLSLAFLWFISELALFLKLSLKQTRFAFLLSFLWPSHYFLQNTYYIETTFAALLLCFFSLMMKYGEERFVRNRQIFWSTVAALICLWRLEMILPVFAILFYFIVVEYRRHGWAQLRRLSTVVSFGLILCASLLPLARNYHNYKEVIPLSSISGRTLWLGTICSDTFYFTGENRPILLKNYVPGHPKATDAGFAEVARENLRQSPMKYLSCLPKKFLISFFVSFNELSWSESPVSHKVFKIYMRLFKIGLVVGGLIGWILLLRYRRDYALIFMLIFAYKFFGIHLFVHGNSRFMGPFEPILLGLMMTLRPRKNWTT